MPTVEDAARIALALPGVREGGPILAVAVDDLGEKAAVLAEHPDATFDIEHLAGCPAVLVRLDLVSRSALAELIETAYLTVAPR